jgi:sulfate adenylyltransferase subunit 2
VRVHPLLDWTELNIWEYIEREKIPIIDLYFNMEKACAGSLGAIPAPAP